MRRLLLVLLLPGCAAMQQPRLPFQTALTAQLEARYAAPTWRDAYDLAITPAERKAARNRILDELVWLANDGFDAYEASLCGSRRTSDTVLDLLQLGLTGAAAATGTLGAATTLSAIATGIGGGRAVVARNYYAEQSCTALSLKMEALRAEALVTLWDGERQPVTSYSLERGLIDVQAYVQAGTLASALMGVVQESTAQRRQALDAIRAMPRGE